MIRVISEPEFAERLRYMISETPDALDCTWVTGPGRSGAIASVYASHILGIPFVPYKGGFGPGPAVLLVDTARESGATMRKAQWYYTQRFHSPVIVIAFEEPPRVAFWYEAPKPQRYRHERPR